MSHINVISYSVSLNMRRFLLAVEHPHDHTINAVTGKGYGFNCVSMESKGLYRVKCRFVGATNRKPVYFYFDSPDQYQLATGMVPTKNSIEDWRENATNAHNFKRAQCACSWSRDATKKLTASLAKRPVLPSVVRIDTLERRAPSSDFFLRSLS